jgi:hypothetical protein
MADATQTFASHRRFFPLFHFVTVPLLVINLIVRIIYAVKHWGARLVWWEVVVALALILLALAARLMALRVQDRLIRLEETIRLGRVLPEDLRSRVGELSHGQLIALRFCDDAEVGELTRAVLAGEVRGREEIKKRIRTWRPDTLRA